MADAEGVLHCPADECDWSGRTFDPSSDRAKMAAEVDAEIHWMDEHDGLIPDDADFGHYQCPECGDILGLAGSASCRDCGYIPEEVRA